MDNTVNTPLDLKVNDTANKENINDINTPTVQPTPGNTVQATPQNTPDAEKKSDTEEEQTPGVYKHTFSKPFAFEGTEYTELTFDFNILKADDAMSVERELNALGVVLLQPEISAEYLVRMAARACTAKISFDIFNKLPLRDYIKIKNKTRNFLLLQG